MSLKLEGFSMSRTPKPWWRKERRSWFVMLDGRQVNLGPNRGEAFRRFHQLMTQPRPRKVPGESVLGVIDAYLDWCSKHRSDDTYRWYRDRLQEFAQTIDPGLTTDSLRPFHVQQWIDSREGWSDGSRRNGIRAVKRVFRWAEEQGYIDRSPVTHLKKPKGGKREVVVSEAEFEDILSLTRDESFRDLLVITWDTGCRPQESLIVEARHVDLVNQRWVFQQSEEKCGKSLRVVYMTDRALSIVKRLMLRYPAGPLFRNSEGNPWDACSVNCAFTRLRIRMGRRLLARTVETNDKRRRMVCVDEAEVEKLAESLKRGIRGGKPQTDARLLHEARKRLTNKAALRLAPKYSLYALRHTWMNRLLTSGVDGLTVAILAGHKDPSMLARHYQHLSLNPKHLLEQAKKAAG
jgi:integrase